MSWTHVLIAQHPDIQQDVGEEIAQHRDQWDEYINNPNTLLAGCVLEASRLHPILRKKLFLLIFIKEQT